MSDVTMLSDHEVIDTENQNVDSASTADEKVDKVAGPEVKPDREKKPTRLIDMVIDEIASVVATCVRRIDADSVKQAMRSVMGTLFSLGALPETAAGLRINGETYRYGEYAGPSWMKDLIPAKRVLVEDVPSGYDLLKHDAYQSGYRVLTPGEFAVAWRMICAKVRISSENPASLDRSDTKLLSEVVPLTVVGGRVRGRSQKTLYFLKQKFDEEANVELSQWASVFASSVILK